MASNPFDQFDAASATPAVLAPRVAPRSRPAQAPATNPFDQFDALPIDKALAQHEDETIAYQAKAQEAYMARMAAAQKWAGEHPELAGPSSMQEPPPALDPYLTHRKPPIAPREAAPKQQMGSGFSATAQLGLVEDQDTKRRILAQTLFPNDPGGIYRVGFDADGQPVYVGDDNKLHKIASGTAAFGAQLAANAPEMIGGGIGAVAGPWGATLGASGMHGIKRGVAGLIYDEPQTVGANLKGMAAEGLSTLAGEGTGKLMNVIGNRNRVIDFTPQDMAAAEAVRQRVWDVARVNLDLAQASGDRRLIALRAYVARYPGPSANLVQSAEERAKGQFHEATERVLDTIANATPAEVAGQEGINAAKLAIQTARDVAQAKVDPLYRAAYEKGAAVMDPEVIRFFRHKEFREAYRKGQDIARLDEAEAPTVTVRTTRTVPGEMPPMTATEVPQMNMREVPTPPGAAQKPPGLTVDQPRLGLERQEAVPSREVAVIDQDGNIVQRPRKFRRERMPSSGVYRTTEVTDEEYMKVPDLRALDNTKRGLDRMVEELMSAGKRNEARALSRQRRRFVAALDNLDIPEYKAARTAWKEELANNINPMENGVVGVLSRIKDPLASKAAARIFSDPNLTPTMVEAAKTAIRKQSPEEWDALSRTWIAHKWNQAQRVTRTSTDVNSPGAFHQALFGTPNARANTMAMLDKPSADALEGVMEAAEGLKRTPIAGSNTFRDQETKAIFEGLTGTGFRIWHAISSPREALRDVAQRRAAEQSTLAVAQGILDPTMRHKLRVILRMKPTTQRNVLLFNVIGAQSLKDYMKSRASQGEDSGLIAGEENAVGQ
jgi:hypothetical protein